VWRPLPFRRFIVQDTSMQPALRPGDRILVWQWPARLKPGDVVAFVEPERPRTISLKRITATHGSGAFELRGDNVNVSRDSRDFGPVPRQLILGRAVYRYLPGTRRGRL
jgi:nickel-type superoxide dismutase maturation protease